MDPYLEGEFWQEFHDTLANAIRAQIMPRLRPKYVALLAKRYVFDRPALGVLDLPPEQRIIYPNVHVVDVREIAAAYDARWVTAPSIELNSPMDEQAPILSLEIRNVGERRLVTVIEILSPVNKRGDSAREYMERRLALMRTNTHLLEIDLIRRGGRIPLEGSPPPAPYYAYLSRFARRPVTEVWAIQLRERLPVLPIPLRLPDEDVLLDLQAAVESCFELVGYERLLDYGESPPPSAFSAEDAAWIAEQLQRRDARPGV